MSRLRSPVPRGAWLACLPCLLLALLPAVLAGLSIATPPSSADMAGFAVLNGLVASPDWSAALASSLVVGTLVAAAALPVGAAAALGAWRLRHGGVVAALLALAVVLPRTALAPGLRAGAVRLGWDQDFAAWALAELTLAAPLVGLAGWLAMRRIDPLLLVAAAAAGAGRAMQLRHVLLPLAWPGLRLGVIGSFLLPFGDAATARLLAGPAHRPLPVLILDGAAAGDPAALTAAALLGLLCLLLLLAAWPSAARAASGRGS